MDVDKFLDEKIIVVDESIMFDPITEKGTYLKSEDVEIAINYLRHENEIKESIPKTKLENFFDHIELICKLYDLSISHEDGHGAFIIENYDQFNIDWLKRASIYTKK